ncbi:protein ABIL2-like isoform X2 [Castanea sativa]|uniref:protein ABIL2-like isoform X2 n=1 Tax=Castanea sativa TaxID=21020 RepID=UPI003F651C66
MTQAKNTLFMESVDSSSYVSAKPESSHHDELFMQQRLHFSDSLKDLKNLRKQLYSAAEHFEVSYSKEDQNYMQITPRVVESLKDYVIKALVNTVDHMGSLAYKVNGFLDASICELSRTELRLSCNEQRIGTCQCFIDHGGLFQQSLALRFPKHHKRYILPAGATTDAVDQSQAMHHIAKEDFCQFRSAAQETTSEISPTAVRKGHSVIRSAQSSSRPGTFQFTKVASKKALENRAVSPYRFSFLRSGSLVKKSSAINSYTANQRFPSEPRRQISLPVHVEQVGTKDIGQHSGKTNRLFKALLSMNKSKREGVLYKYLDEN